MKEYSLSMSFGKVTYYMGGLGPTVVFLHGWGQSFSTYTNLMPYLICDYQVIGLDLPGFGKSEKPNVALSITDYANCLKELLVLHAIKSPVIAAHSFGGRIAIKYCANNHTQKLFLISSAGMRNRSFLNVFRIWRYKILKKIFKIFSKSKYQQLISNAGSRDYRQAIGIMRHILIKAVNYDAQRDLKKITCPTYLLWGVLDQETPY